MNNYLTDYIYQLLNPIFKRNIILNQALNQNFYQCEALMSYHFGPFKHYNFHVLDKDKKTLNVTYSFDEVIIKIDGDTHPFNHLEICINRNGNCIDFIASCFLGDSDELLFKIDNQYIYEPDTKRIYVYNAEMHYGEDEKITSRLNTYDQYGNQLDHSDYGTITYKVKSL